MKEILKNLVETMTLPEDSYLEQDAEILEIFVEEIEEIFEELNPLFTTWFAEPNRSRNFSDYSSSLSHFKRLGSHGGCEVCGRIGMDG